MGHADASVTLRVYGHLFKRAQARLTEKLDAIGQSTVRAAGEIVALRREPTRCGRTTSSTANGATRSAPTGGATAAKGATAASAGVVAAQSHESTPSAQDAYCGSHSGRARLFASTARLIERSCESASAT